MRKIKLFSGWVASRYSEKRLSEQVEEWLSSNSGIWVESMDQSISSSTGEGFYYLITIIYSEKQPFEPIEPILNS